MLDILNGSSVKSAKKGYGSFLTIELDRGRSNIPSGPILLWIYLCSWSLKRGGELVANETSIAAETDLGFMAGKLFERSNFSEVGNIFEFYFSDAICIRVEPDLSNYESDDDLLMLTVVGGETMGYSPALGWQSGEPTGHSL